MKNKLYYITNIIILLINYFVIFELPNTYENLKYIGYVIIFISILMLIRYRNKTRICLLLGIILIMSICLAMSVCLNTYETAFNWQIDLLNRKANIINAKNYLLFLTVMCISIGNIKEENSEIKVKYNPIIFCGCFIILMYALIFGIDRGTIGTYVSNTNVIYEYAIIVYIFAWIYSKDNKWMKGILIVYAGLYCLQGLMYGDRSSAFPMVLTLFLLLYRKKYKMISVLIIGLGGIAFGNLFEIFRNTGTINKDIIQEVIERGLFVNTISYSYYAGTQIIRYSMISENKLMHLFNYIITIFTGGSSKISLSDLANSSGFINKGGGISHTYFYYWGGYIATVIFAIIIGKIIKRVFNSETAISNILKISITVFSIRWFLYYPSALFRTALLIPIICWVICELFTKVIKKNNIKRKLE